MPNVEELLRNAMEEEKFDNLPGKGKPLHLDKLNPHADPDWELAYHVLKESGYTLPWIETIREIEKDIETTRKDFQIAWMWHQDALTEAKKKSYISAEWERSQQVFKEKLISLNKRIRDYNLQVPSAYFQRPMLNFEHELQKITSI